MYLIVNLFVCHTHARYNWDFIGNQMLVDSVSDRNFVISPKLGDSIDCPHSSIEHKHVKILT